MELIQEIDEIINDIKTKIDVLTPGEISNNTIKLSSLLCTLSTLQAHAESKYYELWVKVREISETDGSAEKKAKASSEHYIKRLYELKFKAVLEMIKALKKRTVTLSDESKGVY